MKAIIIISASLIIAGFSSISFGQNKVKEVRKEIRKEVRMEDENGKKVLTISTTENGITEEEVFEGRAAEEKLKELELGNKSVTAEESKKVQVEVIDGKKSIKITTIRNGKETIEKYSGEEAEEKLKQLETAEDKIKLNPN